MSILSKTEAQCMENLLNSLPEARVSACKGRLGGQEVCLSWEKVFAAGHSQHRGDVSWPLR